MVALGRAVVASAATTRRGAGGQERDAERDGAADSSSVVESHVRQTRVYVWLMAPRSGSLRVMVSTLPLIV